MKNLKAFGITLACTLVLGAVAPATSQVVLANDTGADVPIDTPVDTIEVGVIVYHTGLNASGVPAVDLGAKTYVLLEGQTYSTSDYMQSFPGYTPTPESFFDFDPQDTNIIDLRYAPDVPDAPANKAKADVKTGSATEKAADADANSTAEKAAEKAAEKEGKLLPKTGEKSSLGLIFGGLLTTILSAVVIRSHKKESY